MPTRADAERRWAALLRDYGAELRRRRLSDSMVQRASTVLPRLFAQLAARRIADPCAVSEAHLIGFARQLARRRTRTGAFLSPVTQRLYLCAVQRFFAFLLKRGVILVDPARELPLPRVASLPSRVLSEAQARRLVNAPSPWQRLGQRDRAILEILYGTGLRRSECLRLDITDVDLGRHLLFVRNGKGKKDRTLPLGGRALAALDRYLRLARPELLSDSRQAALFLSARGNRLVPSRLHRLIQQHARAAGIAGRVHPHVLRHYAARRTITE